MKCDNCGYSDNGTGDWAHVCGPVKVKHYSNTNNPIDFPKSDEMNERIRELAEQAGLLPVTIGPVVETRHMKKKEQDLEKFAELIVSECAALAKSKSERIEEIKAEDHDDHIRLQSLAWQFEEFGYEIKKHFGVKE